MKSHSDKSQVCKKVKYILNINLPAYFTKNTTSMLPLQTELQQNL